jgi:ferric-dicitrate binding protein FerR (iron transport regulator)
MDVVDEPEAMFYIAWTEGWLQFSRESLHSVFTKMERYYNVEIKIPGNFPSSELITGKLDLKESLEDVLLALADVAKIEYRVDGSKIYVDKKMNEIQRK